MAVFVQALPTLECAAAERFIKKSEENILRRGSVDFREQSANSKAILAKKASRKSLKQYKFGNKTHLLPILYKF